MSEPGNTGRPRGSRDRYGRAMRTPVSVGVGARATTARLIRRCLRDADIAVAELAAACDVARSTANDWLSGRVDIGIGRLRQIAAAIGVPVSYLVG